MGVTNAVRSAWIKCDLGCEQPVAPQTCHVTHGRKGLHGHRGSNERNEGAIAHFCRLSAEDVKAAAISSVEENLLCKQIKSLTELHTPHATQVATW